VVTCSADRCFSACHGPVWSRELTRVLEVFGQGGMPAPRL